jgi:hypothetical protein
MRWNAFSTPCQTFSFGEVEDYSINIRCNLVSTTQDQGAGSLPWAVGCVSAGDTISFASGLHGDTILLENNQVVIGSPIMISAASEDNIWVYGQSTPRVFSIDPTVQATIKGLHVIAGTATDGSGIQNLGILTLQDVQIFRHPGIFGSRLVKNSGTLNIAGTCLVE